MREGLDNLPKVVKLIATIWATTESSYDYSTVLYNKFNFFFSLSFLSFFPSSFPYLWTFLLCYFGHCCYKDKETGLVVAADNKSAHVI